MIHVEKEARTLEWLLTWTLGHVVCIIKLFKEQEI